MKTLIQKIKNPIFISSILSTIFLILSSLRIIHITDHSIGIIINSIMSILSILGVLNAPRKRKHSSKDKTNKK